MATDTGRRDHRAVAGGGVDDALLQPGVPALEDVQRQLVVGLVGVAPELVEQPLRAVLGLGAEGVGQLPGLGRALGVLPDRRLGVDHGRGHGEQLGADVHDPSQEGSVAFGAGLPSCHPVERGARELAAGALDEPHVLGELAVLAVGPGRVAAAERQPGVPVGVEGTGLAERLRLARELRRRGP